MRCATPNCGHDLDFHYDARTTPAQPCQSCGCQAFVRCEHRVTEVQETIIRGQFDTVCVTCGASSPHNTAPRRGK